MPPRVVEVWRVLLSPRQSPQSLPFCGAKPALMARFFRMELNTTVVFGVCTTARFAVLSALQGHSYLRYAGQVLLLQGILLKASQQIKV